MRKNIAFAVFFLLLATGTGAQTPQAMPNHGKSEVVVRSYQNDEFSKLRKLRADVAKATEAFQKNPDSKEARENYLNAQKALVGCQKSIFKSIHQEQFIIRGANIQTLTEKNKQQVALAVAKRSLDSTRRIFEKNPDSPAHRDALAEAQKVVFRIEKQLKEYAPLILADGKEIPSASVLNPNDIRTVTVLKDSIALKRYGEKARNGVVLVTTRSDSSARKSMEEMRIRYMGRAIDLKENQKKAFEDKYKAYNEQIEGLRRFGNELGRKIHGKEALEGMLKNNIIIEQKRLEMYKALEKILSDQQLVKLYRAEMDFARNILRGRMELHSNGGKISVNSDYTFSPDSPKKE